MQETGSLQAIQPYINTRENLPSYLCFIVVSGTGSLLYEGKPYSLQSGDVVFIDCQKKYAHSTSDNLWSLQWCHFYGFSLHAIYEKYQERGGQPVFHPKDVAPIRKLMEKLYELADSSDYIKDMKINRELSALLTFLMAESWNPEMGSLYRKHAKLDNVKCYIDKHYADKITLDKLSDIFYIDKFYMSKKFKDIYGVTIISYLEEKRITKAKSLLRFTDMTIEEISIAVGINSASYFSRVFKRAEGIGPGKYRKLW